MKKINNDVLAVLSSTEINGNIIILTCGQLDRKMYTEVNKILETMGGKWNRKFGGHEFNEDPTNKLESVLLTGEIDKPEDLGFFPTPKTLAEKVIELAGIREDHTVLEPSAGHGSIADEAAKIVGLRNVHCVEILSDNIKKLENKGFLVQGCCFLSIEPKPLYDRIVMNPPFAKQQDIDHVNHAWKCLKPGGRLVSIMSSGVAFRGNRKTTAFRDMLTQYGSYQLNPEGSFIESGTGVNTIIAVLNKPSDCCA